MKSISKFMSLEIKDNRKIIGGAEKTKQLNGKRDRIRDDGTVKTNIDLNPFNNDCHGCTD